MHGRNGIKRGFLSLQAAIFRTWPEVSFSGDISTEARLYWMLMRRMKKEILSAQAYQSFLPGIASFHKKRYFSGCLTRLHSLALKRRSRLNHNGGLIAAVGLRTVQCLVSLMNQI